MRQNPRTNTNQTSSGGREIARRIVVLRQGKVITRGAAVSARANFKVRRVYLSGHT